MFKNLFKRKPLGNSIELCVSNRLYDSDEINVLLERTDISIIESGCNSRCEICDENFYAIVNGDIITAQSAPDLLAQIEEALVKTT